MGKPGVDRTLSVLGIGLGVAVAAAAIVAALVMGTGFSLSTAASTSAVATPTRAAASAASADPQPTAEATPEPTPETVTVTVTVPVSSATTVGLADTGATPAASTPATSSVGTTPAATTPAATSSTTAAGAAAAPSAPRAPRTGNLFEGAYFSPYTAKKPSVGGVRLATLPDTPRLAMTGTFIVLDPGHNGVSDATIFARQVPMGGGKKKACNTSGTQTDSGYPEHAHNWDVVVNLAALLRERGATVILTRPNDASIGPCVDERAAIGNRARADLVVSVHADGNTARAARGFHIITSRSMAGGAAVTSKSLAMATTIRDEFAKGTGMPRSTYTGAGIAITRRTDIAGLNLSEVPAVMLEAGNMRNTGDAALLTSRTYRLKEAHALAAGIQKALGR